jgi:hypothetical protein
MTLRRAFASTFALVLLVAGSACFSACSSPSSSTGVGNPGLTKDEEALVDDGGDGNESGATASTITAIPTFAFAKQAEVATATLATDTAAFSADAFLPHGCAVATKPTTTEVSYLFTDCAGPLGLMHLNGTIVVDYTNNASGVSFKLQTNPDFTINGVPTTHTASGNFDIDATGKKTLTWNGTYIGQTLRGYPVTHTAAYTIVADSGTGCVDIDGTATTDITHPDGTVHGFTMTVTSYVHCGPRTACPSSGTIVLTTNITKITVTVEFNGSAFAKVTTPRGTVPDWPLKCG